MIYTFGEVDGSIPKLLSKLLQMGFGQTGARYVKFVRSHVFLLLVKFNQLGISNRKSILQFMNHAVKQCNIHMYIFSYLAANIGHILHTYIYHAYKLQLSVIKLSTRRGHSSANKQKRK